MCPLSPLSFKIIFEVLATVIREEKEVKISLFEDNMTLYIENPKDTIRKLLEIIS